MDLFYIIDYWQQRRKCKTNINIFHVLTICHLNQYWVWNFYLYGQIGFLCVVLQYWVWYFYLYGQIGFLYVVLQYWVWNLYSYGQIGFLCVSVESVISGQPEADFCVSYYSTESGISGQPEADFHVLYYSIESGISIGIVGFPYLVLQCWVWNLYLYGQIGLLCVAVESGISICTVK